MQPGDAASEAQRLIPDVLQALKRDQASYRLIPPKESLHWTAWMEAHFPMTEWTGIAWQDVPGSIRVEWGTWEEAGEQLRSLCDRIGLAGCGKRPSFRARPEGRAAPPDGWPCGERFD